MKHGNDFLDTDLKERLEKAIHTEELAYPIKLLDIILRGFQLKDLGAELHYWQMIQIHELLNDNHVLPENYDDTIWYQYLSAYLLLPKMEQFIENNRWKWNTTMEVKNRMDIKEAVGISLSKLNATTMVNKIADQNLGEDFDSLLKDEIHAALSRRELSYPINLLEVNLRRLETNAQYWTIREIHEILKYEGVLPAEYSYNIWYKYIAAYIIIYHVGIDKLIGLFTKYGWSEAARVESELLVLNAKIFLYPKK